MRARVLFFTGKDIQLSTKNKTLIQIKEMGEQLMKNHELATIIRGDLEDILYSAMIKVVNEVFRE